MISIKISEKDKIITSETGNNLLKILTDNGEFIEGPCGGRGSCGRCKIKHISGDLLPMTEDEKNFLSEEEINEGIRLACYIAPTTGIEIDIINKEKNHRVLTGGFLPEFNINPAIWKKTISIDKPKLGLSTSYENLFAKALGLKKLDFQIIKNLKMRSGTFTAVYNEDELIGIEYGDTLDETYGLAVDIGTTTVVASLINLNTGKEIDNESEINAQKDFGQDVLTRITYVIDNKEEGTLDLQKSIVDSLNKMVNRICQRQDIDKNRIYEMSVAANSTMMHTLLGIEAISLGKSPYSPIFSSSKNIRAQEIALDSMSYFARLSLLPSISSYIGADIVAGIFVADLQNTGKKVLFIDIGTNGEIVISDKGRLVSCSCAAGPALEGMNISSGMRASDGAIEEMTICKDEISLEVIGNTKPVGLCGSGILAAVREMLACGLVNERGNIIKPESIDQDDFRQKYLIVENKKRSIRINEDIRITQSDIRQVQLAKSAILSGFMALVNHVGFELSDLDQVIVAGQFGAHLPAESLVGTGILPSEVEDKIRYIGNSSKSGAYLYLISLDARKEIESLSKKISYIELSTLEGYEKLFVKSSRFKV